jgi:3-hydroxymyristoyl/3-hydroxydecanoyl-(acyl carrier protein) dehydratase
VTAATVASPARRAAPLRAVDEVSAEPAGAGCAISARLDIGRVDLTGHFPGLPVYPGVFTLESVGQAVATAIGARLHLREIHSGRFLGVLGAADTLLLRIDAQPVADEWSVTALGTRASGEPVVRLKAMLGDPPDPGPGESPPAVTGTAVMDVAAVEAALPHRHPMLLVDRVTAVEPAVLHAEKAVTATEPCYADCDDVPLAGRAYPVSLVLESLGQAAALLWGVRVTTDEILMFAGVRGFRVTGAAYPGDVLRHVVRLTYVKADTAFATGRSWAGDRPVAEVTTLIAAHRRRSVLDEARRHRSQPRQEAG